MRFVFQTVLLYYNHCHFSCCLPLRYKEYLVFLTGEPMVAEEEDKEEEEEEEQKCGVREHTVRALAAGS